MLPFATIPATERNSAAQHQDPSPMSQPFDLPALASSLADKSPQDILKAAFEHFGDELWISFSGAEDVVLVDMAWKLNRNVKVFSLDTGRLHPETYRFIDQVREHYGIAIDVLSPDPRLLEPLVKEKGLFSFYRDGHGECCGIRKIEPLKRKRAPGPPANAATRAPARAARWQCWKSTVPFPRRKSRCTSSTRCRP